MSAIGATSFAALVWTVVLLVLAVFVYEVYVLAVEAGWLD